MMSNRARLVAAVTLLATGSTIAVDTSTVSADITGYAWSGCCDELESRGRPSVAAGTAEHAGDVLRGRARLARCLRVWVAGAGVRISDTAAPRGQLPWPSRVNSDWSLFAGRTTPR